MDWMSQIEGILDRYGSGRPQPAPSTAHADFERVAHTAPPAAVADGLAAAFRSDATPPFGRMLASLFGQSDPSQRAATLNTLIAALGPTVASILLARLGQPEAAAAAERGRVDPETASRVPPESVEAVAEEAARTDRSVIERISRVYASHPQLVRTLGAAALAAALAGLRRRPEHQRVT